MTFGKVTARQPRSAGRPFRLLLGLVLMHSLIGSPAVAETVRVRSGNHASFSRLVVPLSTPVEWILGRSENGYILEVEDKDLEFDLAGAFDRIPRTRITALRADRGRPRLEVDLGCDCHATAFVYGAAAIVIDVNDGPPQPGSRFEMPIDQAAARPMKPSDSIPPLPYAGGPFQFGSVQGLAILSDAEPSEGSMSSLRPEVPAFAQSRQPVWAPNTAPALTAVAVPGVSGDATAKVELAAELAARAIDSERLVRELSRAAAQGLLQPRLQAVDPFESLLTAEPAEQEGVAPPPEPVARADEQSGPELSTPQGPESPPNLRIVAQTSIDRDTGVSRIVRSLGNDAQPCIQDSALDIASWGDTDAPEEGIKGLARHRENLVKEFDRPDPKRVIELVRYYLWLGLGVEARSVLKAFEGEIPAAPIEAAMTWLVDGETGTEAVEFKGQSGCSGRAALWSLLVESDGTLPEGVNRLAVVAAFSELPPGLRSVLGQDLARRFLAAGDRNSTIAIRNALARAGAPYMREAELIDARMAVLEGDTSAGRMLEALAIGNDRIAAEALALQVEAGLDRGENVAGAADAIAGLARTHGEALPGSDLDRLSIRARIAAGDYDEVRADLLRRAAVDGEAGEDRALWSEFVSTVTGDASDAAFLRQAFALRRDLVNLPVDPDARNALAHRLEELGFPEEAGEVRSKAAEEPGHNLMRPGGEPSRRDASAQADTSATTTVEPATGRDPVEGARAGALTAPEAFEIPSSGANRDEPTAQSLPTQGVESPSLEAGNGLPMAADATASGRRTANSESRPLVVEGGVVERAANALETARAARAAIEQRLQALRTAEPSG